MIPDKSKKLDNKLDNISPTSRLSSLKLSTITLSSKLSAIASIVTALGITLLPTVKTSWVVGSYFKFFSAKQILLPISGIFGTLFVSMVSIIKNFLISGSFTGSFITESTLLPIPALYLSSLYLPTLAGSLYWSSYSWNSYTAALIRLGIPATCMFLFGLHPIIGTSAFTYALLWLIPIAIYCVSLISQTAFSRAATHSVFLQALGSTYTVHAVGSVLWLYTRPIAPALWLGLIPIAFIERLCFALAMTGAHYTIAYIAHKIHALNTIKNYSTQLTQYLLTTLSPIK